MERSKKILESVIQKKIINRLQKEGWLCIKLIKTNWNGVPDLICHRNGETMYIEVKQPSGKLSELQKVRIAELKEKGITVKVWQDYGSDFEY